MFVYFGPTNTKCKGSSQPLCRYYSLVYALGVSFSENNDKSI